MRQTPPKIYYISSITAEFTKKASIMSRTNSSPRCCLPRPVQRFHEVPHEEVQQTLYNQKYEYC